MSSEVSSADRKLRGEGTLRISEIFHSLQGETTRAGLPTVLWHRLGLSAGDDVQVSQGRGSLRIEAYHDATLADTAVRVPAGHPLTAGLGPMFGPIAVEKA